MDDDNIRPCHLAPAEITELHKLRSRSGGCPGTDSKTGESMNKDVQALTRVSRLCLDKPLWRSSTVIEARSNKWRRNDGYNASYLLSDLFHRAISQTRGKSPEHPATDEFRSPAMDIPDTRTQGKGSCFLTPPSW